MESRYHCDTCNKNYKTYQTLWKHNKQFHTQNTIISPSFNQHLTNISSSFNQHSEISNRVKKTNRSICKYCKNNYSCYNSVLRHEKTCKQNIINNDVEPSEETPISQQILNILSLKNVDQNTINEINILLSKMNNNVTNNTGNNNNNGVINNTYNIIQLGKENLNELLTHKEKLSILNKKYGSVLELISKAHFNPKYPQLHSIILTNHKTNLLYLYNENSNIFELTNKEDAINQLIEFKVCDIEEFYDEYKDKLSDSVKKSIETIIEDRYENDDKPKVNKKIREDINNLLYNNRHKVKHLLK
jgi:hypothetical protein